MGITCFARDWKSIYDPSIGKFYIMIFLKDINLEKKYEKNIRRDIIKG